MLKFHLVNINFLIFYPNYAELRVKIRKLQDRIYKNLFVVFHLIKKFL
jgi:hypothetical protein